MLSCVKSLNGQRFLIASCFKKMSSQSQRPAPTLSDKEQLILKTKKLAEEAPTHTRIKLWWHSFPTYKVFMKKKSFLCCSPCFNSG